MGKRDIVPNVEFLHERTVDTDVVTCFAVAISPRESTLMSGRNGHPLRLPTAPRSTPCNDSIRRRLRVLIDAAASEDD
jgi:hypothetical protein